MKASVHSEITSISTQTKCKLAIYRCYHLHHKSNVLVLSIQECFVLACIPSLSVIVNSILAAEGSTSKPFAFKSAERLKVQRKDSKGSTVLSSTIATDTLALFELAAISTVYGPGRQSAFATDKGRRKQYKLVLRMYTTTPATRLHQSLLVSHNKLSQGH